jgi:hypothetical protein
MAKRKPPMSATATTNQYVLTASIAADGSLQLSGEDLVDDVIETPRGQDAIVVIKDIEGQYLYGTEIPIRGKQSQCWQRDTAKGLTQRVFSVVNADIVNIVFAAETNDNAKVKYGPVITIKPKG